MLERSEHADKKMSEMKEDLRIPSRKQPFPFLREAFGIIARGWLFIDNTPAATRDKLPESVYFIPE